MIDPISPRYMALLKSEVVPLTISEAKEEKKMVPRHPKVTQSDDNLYRLSVIW